MRWRRGPEPDPIAKLLTSAAVLAVPPSVAPHHVEPCLRLWSPDAIVEPDGTWWLSGGLRLHGPIPYDEQRWRAAGLPSGTTVAYAVQFVSGNADMEPAARDPLAGVCRLLGGQVREAGREWESLYGTQPHDPTVYAPRQLSADEMIDLIGTLLPGLRLVDEGDAGYYRLESADTEVLAMDQSEAIYPLVRREPWYEDFEGTARHAIEPLDGRPYGAAVEQALDLVRAATGGVLLDEFGFPPRRKPW
jgi:hypothetical protein